MSSETAPFAVARRALSKAMKHSFAVCPLEAYGFLVGPGASATARLSLETGAFACAALPVGKTQRWYEHGDRFEEIGGALPALRQMLMATEEDQIPLELHALYHSHYGEHVPAPRHSLPEGLETAFSGAVPVLEVTAHGCDSVWGQPLYVRGARGAWQRIAYEKLHRPSDRPELNPRRILRRWRAAWKSVSYDNHHIREHKRLFGEEAGGSDSPG